MSNFKQNKISSKIAPIRKICQCLFDWVGLNGTFSTRRLCREIV